MDTLSPAERSERMSRVRGKDTKPELVVRKLVHALGYRYRLHRRDLPGLPDLTFPGRGKIIFVHGCFWHRHEGCSLARLPKSRHSFWIPKLEENKRRDTRNQKKLKELGWGILVVWECQISGREVLKARIQDFLEEK